MIHNFAISPIHDNYENLCGFQRGLLFWAQSYLPVNPFSKGNFNLHAPYRYYAVEFNKSMTLMIVLDSPLFAFDVAQQAWFAQLLSDPKYKDYKKTLLMHHPFIDPGNRGARVINDKKADPEHCELVKYQKFIEYWFKNLPLSHNDFYDPRNSYRWINGRINAYDRSAYPTVGCFMADFIVQNKLTHHLNGATVLSAHFHGHLEYEFNLGGSARIKQLIVGATGAKLEEVKILGIAGAPPAPLDLNENRDSQEDVGIDYRDKFLAIDLNEPEINETEIKEIQFFLPHPISSQDLKTQFLLANGYFGLSSPPSDKKRQFFDPKQIILAHERAWKSFHMDGFTLHSKGAFDNFYAFSSLKFMPPNCLSSVYEGTRSSLKLIPEGHNTYTSTFFKD
jgi:hypothetical protein